jgi:hypothetical protein
MSVAELLSNINQEDKRCLCVREKHYPKLSLVTQIVARNWEVDFFTSVPEHQEDWELWMPQVPTYFWVPFDMVVGIVLVVTTPFRVENAEDNAESLERFNSSI